MSGNQQPQISLPTWRYSDFNAAIPIKKRKYFVLPEAAGASSPLLDINPQTKERVDDAMRALDSSDKTHVNQKIIGEPSLSFSVGKNADKPESVGNLVPDQIRVKLEEPINSIPLAVPEIHSSSDIVGNSLGKLPMGAEQQSSVLVNSDKTVLKTHDIVKETCGDETLRGECQTQASAGNVALRLGSITKNNSPYLETQEPTALNLSLSKGVCAPHDPDFISTCTNSGIHNVVNRSNWDLNTTMDAWEDGLDRKTRVKTTGEFLNSNNNTGCPDMETSTCRDTNDIAKSVSEGVKSPTVTLTQFDHPVKSTCSLSLGLGSYPPIEKSPSLSATTSEARSASTSTSRPVVIAGNVNSVNLRTVKSEVIEESVQADPSGPSINRVEQDVVGRFRQENSLVSGSLKPVDSISVKAEPNNFTQSAGFNRKDGTLSHPHKPLVQSNEILDLPTSSTPNQKDKCIPSPNVISNALMSLSRMARNPGVQSYPDSSLKRNPGQSSGRGDHNLNASGVNDSVTNDKPLHDCKTYVSPGTEELPISGEEKVTLSGKDVQRQVSMLAEGYKNAECGCSETEQRDISVPFDGDNQNSHHVEEKESEAALLGNTGYNEGGIVQGGEQSTHQIIHASEGVSGVSTLSGGNGDNPETLDNNSPVSYKADISTFDDDPAAELSEGSPSRIKTLDASESFMERDRLPDFSLGQRKYHSRWSDESCSFSRERYHGKSMRSPRLNFMPHKRRFSDDTETNLHERDTKNFESNSYENTRRGRGGAFTFNSYRGRRPANDEGTSFPHSFTRRNASFSYTQRGPTNKEDASEFHGFSRDGERQSNSFMNQSRPYRGRNSFGRGRTNFTNNSKREYPGFRSRSPVRSRDRSAGPSTSFRNRSQEDFSGNTDFSHRRSPSGYRTGRLSSPEHSGYQREGYVRRHNSPPPYSHRPSNTGRGRGYERGRGYARGRGYGRGDGFSFRKPYDRGVHRNQGNLNNFDPRERVDYSDDFFEGPNHSERFGVDDNAERRQFGYRHDGGSSFRQSFNNDGCAPSNVENDPDAARFGQNPGIENMGEERNLMETDGKNKNSTENASGRSKNMEEEETSKHNEIWQRDELGGGDGF
ncbi:unnamed protein product [Eruca vesicaria subsp. sativa]|uniref:Uncharacterized protein n=1 Tax=Eruca vesicaria subsp. sativa TaxID=29727 RepID=A0ABC8JH24_ERUVS|nr:unnamed protein product [Eruca vesicaria subsp. sativa]